MSNQPPQNPQGPNPYAQQQPLTPTDEKMWATLIHVGGIFLVFKDRGTLTRQESKEALNWQITFTIGFIILQILVAIISAALLFSNAYAIVSLVSFLPFLLWVVNAIFSILGGVKVNGGGSYRYPVALRLIK